jgi:hypothetical protein
LRSKIIFICLIIVSLAGCKIRYSFTGVQTDAETVTVRYFAANAPLAKPTSGQTFTEALKDILTSQGKLNLVSSGGDLVFEGSISGYATSPVAIQSNDQAALTRLTITVNVKFTNLKDETKSFETSFSRFADYNSSQSLAAVEDQLIKDITDQLVQDIFNKALQNW